MRTFGFAFGKENISSRVLWRLKNIDCCHQVFGESSIGKYMEFLLRNKPEYILGLGVYSGKDQNKIRIETLCTNKFRNELREGSTLKKSAINPFLEPSENSKYASGIGNSYCNLTAWKITKLIKEEKLSSQFTFLHIPEKMKTWFVIKEIDKILGKFLVDSTKT